MAVSHQKLSMASSAAFLWVLIFFNLGALQASGFDLGSIPGFGGNPIPGLSNVGNFLGLGQCDLHLDNIFKCNQEIKNFNGAPKSSPLANSPLPGPAAADTQYPSATEASPGLANSPADAPAYSPTMSPPVPAAAGGNSPAPSPAGEDSEEAADLNTEERMSMDPATSLVADKAAASDSSNSNAPGCCRAILHIHLKCLCSVLNLKLVMLLQLAEGYLGKVASMCHIDFQGC